MIKRTLYLTAICLLFASTACMQKALPPESLSTPEFMSVKCDVKTSGNDRSAILSAVLNSSNGIEESGFMFGSNEAEMRFIATPIEDCSFTTELSALTPGDYVYYATVSNGRNTVRTNMFNFTIEQGNSSTIITPPDSGDDNDSGLIPDDGNNGDGSKDDGQITPPDNKDDDKPLPPPEDTALPISDSTFLRYLLAHFDTDNNGIITKAEAEAARSIEIVTDEVKTLDGIAYFTNIETLNCAGSPSLGGLTGLLLGSNSRLQVLDCSHNHIKKLVIPLSIKELNCRYNELHEVHFSQCPNLRKLDIFGNYASALDISKLTELEELTCGMNSFKTLDVSHNLKLKILDLSDSPILETVYVARGQRIPEIIAENRINFEFID